MHACIHPLLIYATAHFDEGMAGCMELRARLDARLALEGKPGQPQPTRYQRQLLVRTSQNLKHYAKKKCFGSKADPRNELCASLPADVKELVAQDR